MSDDESMGEVLSPDFQSAKLELKKRSLRGCKHMRVIVDDELRRVKCRDCDVELDPIQVLVEYAMKERQFLSRHKEMESMFNRMKELKNEELRLRSRISGLKKKERARVGH